jgi:hypothetical protein
MTDKHQPGAFYWSADSDECPHGPQPDYSTDGEAWDVWRERHPSSDDGPVCLDAPAGEACLDCSADDGDMVPWANCRVREHARPKQGLVPTVDASHEPVTVLVGTLECLDRECDEYFGDDGNEDPGVERCSHIREEQACSCQRGPDGEYGNEPCPARLTTTP